MRSTLALLGILAWALPAGAADLEPGAGSDIVLRACSNCHTIDNVLQVRKNRADWDTTVHLMRNYGLEISDEDMQKAIDYLSSYYGFQPHPPAK
jgi:hypothetical protein